MSRNLHLGLDWGTSATKLVLRDYDAPGASRGLGYVVRAAAGGVRHPSLVVLEGERLWFGESARARVATAKHVWASLKTDVAVHGRVAVEATAGLQVRDLSVLYLAHILSVARRAACNLPNGQSANMGFKLGVPTGEMNRWGQSTEYLRIARAALHIANGLRTDPDGLAVGVAPALLRGAWTAVEAREARARTTGEVIEAWLRPEAASEMIWPFNSPSIRPGLYTAVDVGAGTTNACFFMIHSGSGDAQRDPKGALSFFGAACSAPGLNDLLRAVSEGNESAASLEKLRGNENALLAESARRRRLATQVIKAYRGVWSTAKQEAWGAYPGYAHWDGLRLLVVGGGRKVDLVRREFERRDPFGLIKGFDVVPELGVPGDLRELPARPGAAGVPFRDDATFLLTAYGLSFETDDLPEITLPAGVPPFRPAGRVRQFVAHEDIGYEKR